MCNIIYILKNDQCEKNKKNKIKNNSIYVAFWIFLQRIVNGCQSWMVDFRDSF